MSRELRAFALASLALARITLLALAALASVCVLCAAAQQAPRTARFAFELGPSFDSSPSPGNGRPGYFIGGRGELGSGAAFTFGMGFEHYPLDGESRLVPFAGQTMSTLRIEGGGGKTVLTESLGLRLGFPGRRAQPFIELGLGGASVHQPSRRFVDPATGAEIYPADTRELSALSAELGAGVRTRRTSGLDWSLALRWRGYAQLFETESGSALQLRVVATTR